MKILKQVSLVLLIGLYIGAGINHFWHPAGYLSIIPPYLPAHETINIIAGIAELIAGALLIFKTTRKAGAYLVILLLIAFIPAHVYMIQKGGCMGPQICISKTAAWLRLFPLQFILIWWAWVTGRQLRNEKLRMPNDE